MLKVDFSLWRMIFDIDDRDRFPTSSYHNGGPYPYEALSSTPLNTWLGCDASSEARFVDIFDPGLHKENRLNELSSKHALNYGRFSHSIPSSISTSLFRFLEARRQFSLFLLNL